MIKAVVLGLLCFILFLALHVIVFRLFELKERFRALSIIFYSLIPLYLLLYNLVPSGYMVLEVIGQGSPLLQIETLYRVTGALNFLSGLMLYIFLFLGYCQFYFIVDRSISVRIMIEIEKNPQKKLSFDEIQKVYSFNGILSRRLVHMIDGKYLKEDGGYYLNTKKGRAEALLFGFLKDFLRLGNGG